MRIARIEIDRTPRTAIVSPDGESARVLAPEVSVERLLASDPDEREHVAGPAVDELAVADARMLAPVQPTTVRDFSVFEQHIEGVIKNQSPDAEVPPSWYESPFCYFSNPHAVTGANDEIPVPPGCVDLD